MKVIPLLLAASILPAWAGPSEDCAHPKTLQAVRSLIYEQLLPASFRQDIKPDFFLDATAIGMASAVDYNRDLKLATCEAQMTVDATHGLDRETDQALQIAFVHSSAELRMMIANATKKIGPNGKAYTYAVRYTVQPVAGDTMVRVAPLSQVNAALVEGFTRATAMAAKNSMPSSSQAPAGQTAKVELPQDVASREFNIADKALNSAYKSAMARLNPEAQTSLRNAQRQWIKQRDSRCTPNPAGGIGAGSIGELDAIACRTSMTEKRTSEIQGL